MAQYSKFIRIVMLVFMGLVAFFRVGFSVERESLEGVPDVFVHKSTTIVAGQAIGKLMVAGGDVSIGGKVTDEIMLLTVI